MKAKRIEINEGGSMPGVGIIHIDEINPTLKELEKSLGINLRDNVLGSVGKVDFSGDIDVALQIDPKEIPDFMEKLKKNPLISDMSKSSVIMTKVKIVNYDPSKESEDGRARTGFVQVDFMPGDPGWLKTYYHSPGKDSKYKGVFRNIMIATIAAVYDRQDSEEQIADGRPAQSERYLWSPSDGLVRVRRTPAQRKDGKGYTAKNINTKIGGPWKTANEIATQLGLDSGADLHSYETLKNAIEKNYPKEMQDKIFQSFKDNKQVQDIGVPSDLGESDLHRAILKGLTEAYRSKVNERSLSKGEEKDKEKYVKGMKKNKKDFKKRYGKDAEAVMYATATKMAKESINEGPFGALKRAGKFMKKSFDVGNKSGEIGQARDLKNLIKPPKDAPKDTTSSDATPAMDPKSVEKSGLLKGIMKGASLRAVKPNNLRAVPNGARYLDSTNNKKYQYDKPKDEWFNIDDYKDKLRGPDGFRGFQRSDKVVFDSYQFDDKQPLLLEGARIDHAEDLTFWEGSSGALRALDSLESLEQGGHKNATVKWDGSPAVIFGRNEDGEFVFTDKSGFTAQGYDGRANSAEELQAMLSKRPGANNPNPQKKAGFEQFITRMVGVYDLFEQAVPQSHVGYFKGDMLYFDTPQVEEGHYVFKPNIVQYSIDVNSDLGKRIGRSKTGIVIHREVDEDGSEFPLKDVNIFEGNTVLVVPPVTVEQPPEVDNESIEELRKYIGQHAGAIDDLLNVQKLTQMKMKGFPKILYNYTNTKVDSGLDNLGRDFVKWLDTVKMSGPMKNKIMQYISDNAQAFASMWTVVRGIMSIKDSIIRQMEKTSSVRANIPGHGEGGEGFVVTHPKGDIKLVGREFFTKANRAVER